jgi:hypothetical protein
VHRRLLPILPPKLRAKVEDFNQNLKPERLFLLHRPHIRDSHFRYRTKWFDTYMSYPLYNRSTVLKLKGLMQNVTELRTVCTSNFNIHVLPRGLDRSQNLVAFRRLVATKIRNEICLSFAPSLKLAIEMGMARWQSGTADGSMSTKKTHTPTTPMPSGRRRE